MRKCFISPKGIIGEILLLLLLLCLWLSATKFSDKGHGEGKHELSNKTVTANVSSGTKPKEDFIKWVEFNVCFEALNQAYGLDVETYQQEVHLGWVELLAYLGAKYGGDFSKYQESDMEDIAKRLKSGQTTMELLSANMKYYTYYREAYGAVLDGMVGEYRVEEVQGENSTEKNSAEKKLSGEGLEKKVWKKYYGLKAYSPIAKGFPYTEFDDFGVSRSYGYRRNHLGHDMMGQIGTPVIAVESGYVKIMGWNQYGGWRVGISSFDGRRYYYYAHLRQNVPFAKSLIEGAVVQAGDVIGYMGRTGYSKKENVNNIDTSHLHFGLQLIFHESQREGNNEIWVNVYPLVRFLSQNGSEVLRNDADKSWYRKYEIKDPKAEAYKDKAKAPSQKPTRVKGKDV